LFSWGHLWQKINFPTSCDPTMEKTWEITWSFLKILSRTCLGFDMAWGADKTSVLWLYRAVMHLKIDYACASYGSARKNVLNKLDMVHYTALCIFSSTFRTSSIQSLYTDCSKRPLCHICSHISLRIKPLSKHLILYPGIAKTFYHLHKLSKCVRESNQVIPIIISF